MVSFINKYFFFLPYTIKFILISRLVHKKRVIQQLQWIEK